MSNVSKSNNNNIDNIKQIIGERGLSIFSSDKLEHLNKQLETYQDHRWCFGKHNTQFMMTGMVLDIVTPLRTARQCLAEIERLYAACRENDLKIRKLKMEKKHKQMNMAKSGISTQEHDTLALEIEEADYQIQQTELYFTGALKSIKLYIDAFEDILKAKGVEEFDELDFEQEEIEYHIKTALLQSLRNIREKGTISEGNQMYLEHCGIDPSFAQYVLRSYHDDIENKLKDHKEVDTSTQTLTNLINNLYQNYKNHPNLKMQAKQMKLINSDACYIKPHNYDNIKQDINSWSEGR